MLLQEKRKRKRRKSRSTESSIEHKDARRKGKKRGCVYLPCPSRHAASKARRPEYAEGAVHWHSRATIAGDCMARLGRSLSWPWEKQPRQATAHTLRA